MKGEIATTPEQELYEAVHEYVRQAFVGSPRTIRHLEGTAELVRHLKPEADEALLIAAVSHDIERSEPPGLRPEGRSMTDPEFFAYHQSRGARLMVEFLEARKADHATIQRVCDLILKHEVGGNNDQNLLKDADSLSFFEINTDHFVTDKVDESSAEDVQEKLRWMFERITYAKVRETAKLLYQDALRRITERLPS